MVNESCFRKTPLLRLPSLQILTKHQNKYVSIASPFHPSISPLHFAHFAPPFRFTVHPSVSARDPNDIFNFFNALTGPDQARSAPASSSQSVAIGITQSDVTIPANAAAPENPRLTQSESAVDKTTSRPSGKSSAKIRGAESSQSSASAPSYSSARNSDESDDEETLRRKVAKSIQRFEDEFEKRRRRQSGGLRQSGGRRRGKASDAKENLAAKPNSSTLLSEIEKNHSSVRRHEISGRRRRDSPDRRRQRHRRHSSSHSDDSDSRRNHADDKEEENEPEVKQDKSKTSLVSTITVSDDSFPLVVGDGSSERLTDAREGVQDMSMSDEDADLSSREEVAATCAAFLPSVAEDPLKDISSEDDNDWNSARCPVDGFRNKDKVAAMCAAFLPSVGGLGEGPTTSATAQSDNVATSGFSDTFTSSFNPVSSSTSVASFSAATASSSASSVNKKNFPINISIAPSKTVKLISAPPTVIAPPEINQPSKVNESNTELKSPERPKSATPSSTASSSAAIDRLTDFLIFPKVSDANSSKDAQKDNASNDGLASDQNTTDNDASLKARELNGKEKTLSPSRASSAVTPPLEKESEKRASAYREATRRDGRRSIPRYAPPAFRQTPRSNSPSPRETLRHFMHSRHESSHCANDDASARTFSSRDSLRERTNSPDDRRRSRSPSRRMGSPSRRRDADDSRRDFPRANYSLCRCCDARPENCRNRKKRDRRGGSCEREEGELSADRCDAERPYRRRDSLDEPLRSRSKSKERLFHSRDDREGSKDKGSREQHREGCYERRRRSASVERYRRGGSDDVRRGSEERHRRLGSEDRHLQRDRKGPYHHAEREELYKRRSTSKDDQDRSSKDTHRGGSEDKDHRGSGGRSRGSLNDSVPPSTSTAVPGPSKSPATVGVDDRALDQVISHFRREAETLQITVSNSNAKIAQDSARSSPTDAEEKDESSRTIPEKPIVESIRSYIELDNELRAQRRQREEERDLSRNRRSDERGRLSELVSERDENAAERQRSRSGRSSSGRGGAGGETASNTTDFTARHEYFEPNIAQDGKEANNRKEKKKKKKKTRDEEYYLEKARQARLERERKRQFGGGGGAEGGGVSLGLGGNFGEGGEMDGDGVVGRSGGGGRRVHGRDDDDDDDGWEAMDVVDNLDPGDVFDEFDDIIRRSTEGSAAPSGRTTGGSAASRIFNINLGHRNPSQGDVFGEPPSAGSQDTISLGSTAEPARELEDGELMETSSQQSFPRAKADNSEASNRDGRETSVPSIFGNGTRIVVQRSESPNELTVAESRRNVYDPTADASKSVVAPLPTPLPSSLPVPLAAPLPVPSPVPFKPADEDIICLSDDETPISHPPAPAPAPKAKPTYNPDFAPELEHLKLVRIKSAAADAELKLVQRRMGKRSGNNNNDSGLQKMYDEANTKLNSAYMEQRKAQTKVSNLQIKMWKRLNAFARRLEEWLMENVYSHETKILTIRVIKLCTLANKRFVLVRDNSNGQAGDSDDEDDDEKIVNKYLDQLEIPSLCDLDFKHIYGMRGSLENGRNSNKTRLCQLTTRGREMVLESDSAFPLIRLDFCSVCVVGTSYLGEGLEKEVKAAMVNRLASEFLKLGAVCVSTHPNNDFENLKATKKKLLTLLKLAENSPANGDVVLLVTFRLAEVAKLLLWLSTPIIFEDLALRFKRVFHPPGDYRNIGLDELPLEVTVKKKEKVDPEAVPVDLMSTGEDYDFSKIKGPGTHVLDGWKTGRLVDQGDAEQALAKRVQAVSIEEADSTTPTNSIHSASAVTNVSGNESMIPKLSRSEASITSTVLYPPKSEGKCTTSNQPNARSVSPSLENQSSASSTEVKAYHQSLDCQSDPVSSSVAAASSATSKSRSPTLTTQIGAAGNNKSGNESSREDRSIYQALNSPSYVIQSINVVASREERNIVSSSPPLTCRQDAVCIAPNGENQK